MALIGPQPLVEQTLLAAGIDSIIPIYPNLDEAGRGLQASATKTDLHARHDVVSVTAVRNDLDELSRLAEWLNSCGEQHGDSGANGCSRSTCALPKP